MSRGRGHNFWDRLAAESDLADAPFPGLPIVELAGERRVLIENHCGVTAYSREQILVKVKYGHVLVCGCNLELTKMTAEQLVICGRIDGVTLRRRG